MGMAGDIPTAATLLEATRAGNHGVTLPLRVDTVEPTPDHDWWAQLVHCSDVTGTHVKLTVFDDDDCELAEYPFDAGAWYEFSDVSPDVYQGTIGLTAKWTRQVTPLESRPDGNAADASLGVRRLGDATAIAALDIETITTVSEGEREPTEPAHHELLCTGLGYRAGPDAALETTVIFRDDASPAAELEAIETVIRWLDDREIDVVVTFAGAWFDLPMLVGRAERVAADLDAPDRGQHVRDVLESLAHADLSATKNRALGEGALEDLAAAVDAPVPTTQWPEYDLGIDPSDWREDQWAAQREAGRDPPADDLADPAVFNSDVPYLGDAWLTAQATGADGQAAALRTCLDEYTRGDIEPLFAIADAAIAAGQPAFPMSY